ncbi:Histidine kinase-, DNA gyrase B-, and HSP90-like ATPase [Roseateles sp. YR242]|uniref:hybrid sensor histidine kinase/response regulator n=1 Tax=Roseateles sp. YR242 TaxID=1855305 RepID=UPI0008D8ABDC|nr:histidine kinase [Roseateles sp. YR242]SEL46360.1 Histidine kinase-, DNA gyrase B-, and HSP90-like ATPase [Roseateles sp. YR242]
MPALPLGERRLRLLHIEDSDLDHQLILAQLQRAGLSFEISRLDSLPAVETALNQGWDAIISDYNLPGFSGLVVLDLLKQRQLVLPFVLVSGEIGEDTAVAAMRNGASDYLLKNNLVRLAPALLHAIESCEAQRARLESDRELIKSKQQLHELAGHLQTSVEMERAAIAREIHDDVGGSLTALKFDLAWIARHCDDAAVQQRVNSALETVSSAIESSQRIMHNLRPAILEQGLLAAVQWLAARFERRTGIPTAVRSGNETLQLPAGVPLVAYRTAQEALTNVSKHANASRVDVELSMDGGVLTLEVKDNGQGLAPGDLSKARSFGIRGLRERAATVGGWVDLSSGVHGTSLILSVPLRGVVHAFDEDFADEGGPGGSATSAQSAHDPSTWGQL